MKLNYRDKVILGVILAVIILIAGFVLLIKPKNEEIKTDKETLATKQEEQADLEARIAKIEPLKNNINETYEETAELTADFIALEDVNTVTKLDKYMQYYAEESGVRIDNLEVTSPKEASLNYYYNDDTSILASDMLNMADLNGEYSVAQNETLAESTALSERNVETVIQTQYGIKVTGTKEALWSYLQAVEDLGKTMIVNQVSITDYSFGADSAEENSQQTPVDETVTDENAEQPVDETVDANAETPVPAQAPETITIDNSNTSSIQIVISLYSVYDMPKPNTENNN